MGERKVRNEQSSIEELRQRILGVPKELPSDTPKVPVKKITKTETQEMKEEDKLNFDAMQLTEEQERIRTEFIRTFKFYLPYNPIIHKKMKFPKWIRYKWNLKFHPEKVFQIRMELENGYHKTFLVVSENKGFMYRKGRYIFDEDMIYFDLDAGKNGLWTYNYHEGYPLPVRSRIPKNDIIMSMKAEGQKQEIIQIEHATNPLRLQQFIDSTIIEQILKGGELLDLLKKLLLIGLGTLLGIIIVGIIVYNSGNSLKDMIEPMKMTLDAIAQKLQIAIIQVTK